MRFFKKKKEIWPIRCGGNPVLYVDLKNCDQVGLAEEILKTAYGWSQERIDKLVSITTRDGDEH